MLLKPSRRTLLVMLLFAIALLFTTSVLAEDVPRFTFATKRFGGVQLMTVGIDGSNPVQLTDEAEDASSRRGVPMVRKWPMSSARRPKGKSRSPMPMERMRGFS